MARNDLGFILWNNNEEKTMNYNLVTNDLILNLRLPIGYVLYLIWSGLSTEDSGIADLGDLHQQRVGGALQPQQGSHEELLRREQVWQLRWKLCWFCVFFSSGSTCSTTATGTTWRTRSTRKTRCLWSTLGESRLRQLWRKPRSRRTQMSSRIPLSSRSEPSKSATTSWNQTQLFILIIFHSGGEVLYWTGVVKFHISSHHRLKNNKHQIFFLWKLGSAEKFGLLLLVQQQMKVSRPVDSIAVSQFVFSLTNSDSIRRKKTNKNQTDNETSQLVHVPGVEQNKRFSFWEALGWDTLRGLVLPQQGRYQKPQSQYTSAKGWG